jgi:hypothetical protein
LFQNPILGREYRCYFNVEFRTKIRFLSALRQMPRGAVWLNLSEGLKAYEFRSGIDGQGQGCFLVSIREGDGGISDRDDGGWEGEGFGQFLIGGRILRN